MQWESPIQIVDIVHELREGMEDAVISGCAKYGVKVDRDELIRALKYDREQYEKGFCDGIEAAQKAAQKTGRWIRRQDGYLLQCEFCNRSIREPFGYRFNYCPNCGARMD